ncbi:MAG TPA: hypothetical protein VIQ29_16255 [Ancylobacter sp.]
MSLAGYAETLAKAEKSLNARRRTLAHVKSVIGDMSVRRHVRLVSKSGI